MILISGGECYSKMEKTDYGCDAYRNKLESPEGFQILPHGTELENGDIPFDVYAGWLFGKFGRYGKLDKRYHHHAYNQGRWTTWARPIKGESK